MMRRLRRIQPSVSQSKSQHSCPASAPAAERQGRRLRTGGTPASDSATAPPSPPHCLLQGIKRQGHVWEPPSICGSLDPARFRFPQLLPVHPRVLVFRLFHHGPSSTVSGHRNDFRSPPALAPDLCVRVPCCRYGMTLTASGLPAHRRACDSA
jgi:hypothetical protein